MLLSTQDIERLSPGYKRFYYGESELLDAPIDLYQRGRLRDLYNRTDNLGRLIGTDLESLKTSKSRYKNIFFWRGISYYMGLRLSPLDKLSYLAKDEREVKSDLLESIIQIDDLLENEMEETGDLTYSLLDHQRNNFLVIFKSYFSQLFSDPGLIEYFQPMVEMLSEAVSNLYYFCLSKPPIFNHLNNKLLSDLLPWIKLDHSSWWRELDDPLKILFYSANVIEERRKPFEVVINPFSGALELGFALKTVSEILNNPVVNDIVFFDYSVYDRGKIIDISESADEILSDIIQGSFPKPLADSSMSRMWGKESFILDDNLTTGKTLFGMKRSLLKSGISPRVFTGAIELGREDRAGRFSVGVLENLDFMPIGDRMSAGKKARKILEPFIK